MKRTYKLILIAIIIAIITTIVLKNKASATDEIPESLGVGSSIYIELDGVDYISYSYNSGDIDVQEVGGEVVGENSNHILKLTFGNSLANHKAEITFSGTKVFNSVHTEVEFKKISINITDSAAQIIGEENNPIVAEVVKSSAIKEGNSVLSKLTMKVNDSAKELTTALTSDNVRWECADESILKITQGANNKVVSVEPKAVGTTAIRVIEDSRWWGEIPVEITEANPPVEPAAVNVGTVGVNSIIEVHAIIPENMTETGAYGWSLYELNGEVIFENVSTANDNTNVMDKGYITYKLKCMKAGSYETNLYFTGAMYSGDTNKYRVDFGKIAVTVTDGASEDKRLDLSSQSRTVEYEAGPAIAQGTWDSSTKNVEVGGNVEFTYTFPSGVKEYKIKATTTSSSNGCISLEKEFGNYITRIYEYDSSTATTTMKVKCYGIHAGSVNVSFEVEDDVLTNSSNQEHCTTTIPDITVNINPTTPEIEDITNDKITLNVNQSRDVTLKNSFHANASWEIEDASIAKIEVIGDTCKVTGLSAGTTTLVAISNDDTNLKDRVTVEVTASGEEPNNDDRTLVGMWDSSKPTSVEKDGEWKKVQFNLPNSATTPQIKSFKITISQSSTNGGKLKLSKNNTGTELIGDSGIWQENNNNHGYIAFYVQGETAGNVKLSFDVDNIVVKESGNETTYNAMSLANNGSTDINIAVTESGSGEEPNDNITPRITPPGPIQISVGSTKTLSAGNVDVTWSSSDPSKVTIGSHDGVMEGIAVTTTPVTITATATNGGLKDTVKVSVVQSGGQSGGQSGSQVIKSDDPVISSSAGTTVKVGESLKLTSDRAVTWYSGDSSIATVDSDGTVKGVGSGTVQIVGKTSEGRFSSISISVDATDSKTNTSTDSTPTSSTSTSNTSTSSTDGATSVNSASNKAIPATGEATGGVIAAIGIVVLIIGAAILRKKSK